MAEVPHDLIRRIQISSRNAAGLSDYDPTLTLPALPSLSAIIPSLDPSPPYLRCSHCKGRLLRGLQSFMCVYCGNPHQNDVDPDPICFNSTIGYQWLLQSLQLDGSELIGKSEQNRPQGDSKGEIPLSDSLNFKIAWPAESEKQDTSISDKPPEQSRRSLNFTGVDLDNFFSELRRDVSDRTVEQPVTSNQVRTPQLEVTAPDNLNLFQDVQPTELAFKSEDTHADAFSGWEAEFQHAAHGNHHDDPNASDLFVSYSMDSGSVDSGKESQDTKLFDPFGPEVDLSAHMDSLFTPGTSINDGKSKDNSVDSPAFGDWSSNDLQHNLSSSESHLAEGEGFDATFNPKDVSILRTSDHSPANVDWFQDGQWKSHEMDEHENTTLSKEDEKEDDSFDEWDDFTGSASTQDPSKNVFTQIDNQPSASLGEPSEIDLLSSNNKFEEMDFGSFSQPNLFPGSSNNDNFSKEENTNLQDVPAPDRLDDTNKLSDDVAKDREILAKSTESNDDVKMLISQMHDLSFMLKSDLSIPSKSDSSNTSQ